jgi:tagaturonate epimerase
MQLGKYSFGIGDRFAQQGEAQLKAFIKAGEKGIDITPVWNKSNREHLTIGSDPADTRAEADNAVKNLNWQGSWLVDADHINMSNVDKFTESSDFFTIDVADYIGKKAPLADLENFAANNLQFSGEFKIPGIDASFAITSEMIRSIGEKFLFALSQAANIYRHIELKKGKGNFITEISMDEVNESQSPVELFFILGTLASMEIPVQTIAPKFSGRFNKGVDYQGDLNIFEKEFEQDLLVIDMAVKQFGLPSGLKLSVHSGSDKFSIYPVMGKLIRKHNKGIHIKTAGTTWLEEMIGLAMAGGEALDLAKEIYKKGLVRYDELCGPYSTVIDINTKKLPDPSEVSGWTDKQFADALRHEPGHPGYNPDMRQLVHVAYKVAAETGEVYINMLRKHKGIIGQQVTENIYRRHFGRLFDL